MDTEKFEPCNICPTTPETYERCFNCGFLDGVFDYKLDGFDKCGNHNCEKNSEGECIMGINVEDCGASITNEIKNDLSNNDLRFILSQKIGIFYLSHSWGKRMFNNILDFYPKEYIFRVRIHGSNPEIYLKDGTEILFMPAKEYTRGYCFSKIILQEGIDKDFIKCVIKPQLKHLNRKIMEIDNNFNLNFIV